MKPKKRSKYVYEEISSEQVLDLIPKQGLQDLVKSNGVKLSGDESEDELKGMLKVLPQSESLNTKIKHMYRKYKKEDANAPVGYLVQIQMKLPQDADIDQIASQIRKVMSTAATGSSVLSGNEVRHMDLSKMPLNLMENQDGVCLPDDALDDEDVNERYIYHHDYADSDLIPDVNEDRFDDDEDEDLEILVERPHKMKLSKFIRK